MKTLRSLVLLFAAASTTFLSSISLAETKRHPNSSPKDARDDARKIAVKFRAQGYTIVPIATGDNRRSQTEFVVEVNKGVDYVFMVGIDEAIGAVDMYVKDETGNMIAQDTRDLSRACVDFTASYNGTVTIIVDPLKNDPEFPFLGHFALLSGGQVSGY